MSTQRWLGRLSVQVIVTDFFPPRQVDTRYPDAIVDPIFPRDKTSRRQCHVRERSTAAGRIASLAERKKNLHSPQGVVTLKGWI